LDGLPGGSMEMVGEEGATAESFDVSVEPDKLRAIKIYVATSDQNVLAQENYYFRFAVEEIANSDERESGSFEAIFHSPNEK